MGGLESSAAAEGVGGLVVLSIAFRLLCSDFLRYTFIWLMELPSPEGKAGCRPLAPAVLTYSDLAALVFPAQPDSDHM